MKDAALQLACKIVASYQSMFCPDCGVITARVATDLNEVGLLGSAMITRIHEGVAVEVTLSATCLDTIYGFTPFTVRIGWNGREPINRGDRLHTFLIGADHPQEGVASTICAQVLTVIREELEERSDARDYGRIERMYDHVLGANELDQMRAVGSA